MLLTSVCLTSNDVRRLSRTSNDIQRHVRSAGRSAGMARIGSSGPARPVPARPGSADLAQGCCCALPLQGAGNGHIVAASRTSCIIYLGNFCTVLYLASK